MSINTTSVLCGMEACDTAESYSARCNQVMPPPNHMAPTNASTMAAQTQPSHRLVFVVRSEVFLATCDLRK
jgi:hypothetical protein